MSLFAILALALVVTACSGLPFVQLDAGETPTPSPEPVTDPNRPVDSDDDPGGEPDWLPQPGDKDLLRSPAEISEAEIYTLESFPLQFNLYLSGYKGTPCSMLRIEVDEPDDLNQIMVQAYTVTDPDVICIQVLESFDVNVPLGSYETGAYTVFVNGQQLGEIAAP